MPILIVGNAVLDIVLAVEHTPHEDEEMRADARHMELGGNGANTARVLARLGRRVTLLSTVADDTEAAILCRLLDEEGVGTQLLKRIEGADTPVSYILLDAKTGARTIVHHRELAELRLEDFEASSTTNYGWLHFEGRNIAEVARMIERSRASEPGGRISIEIEKPRAGIEGLIPSADLVLFSRAYAEAKGHDSAASLLAAMHAHGPHGWMTCTWGAEGAWLIDARGELTHCPAFEPTTVVDTIGAGDVFNAAMIAGLASALDPIETLQDATHLASKKVGQHGFTGI